MSKHYSSLYDFDDATVGLQALAAFVVVQEAKGDFPITINFALLF